MRPTLPANPHIRVLCHGLAKVNARSCVLKAVPANVARIKSNAMQRVVGLAGRPAARSRARTRVRMIDLGARVPRPSGANCSMRASASSIACSCSDGEEVRAFEAEMAAFVGTKYVKGVASGTDALRLGARAAGDRPGRRGAHPGQRLRGRRRGAASTAARGRCRSTSGATTSAPTRSISPRSSTPRTRGILVVHLYGLPVDMDPIVALARERDLRVIEDCSHAHGATLDGRTRRHVRRRRRVQPGRREEPRRLRRRGHREHRRSARSPTQVEAARHPRPGAKKNEHAFYGGNSRLDELHAADAAGEARTAGRPQRAARRDRGVLLEPLAPAASTTPSVDPRRTHVYHQYVIRTPRATRSQRHLAKPRRSRPASTIRCRSTASRPGATLRRAAPLPQRRAGGRARFSRCRCTPT